MLLASRRELDAAGRRSNSCRELEAADGLAEPLVLRSSKLNVLLGSNEVRLEEDLLRGGSSRPRL